MANRRPDHFEREPILVAFDHPSVTATTTWKAYKVPAGKKLQVTRATYINPTGLAGAAGNAFAGIVRKAGATTMATLFNTDTGAGGATLAADTFVDGVLHATVTNQWGAATEVIDLTVTETGTATLPAGRLVIEGFLY